MIKCPNCGSTAQVKKNVPHTDKHGNYINMEYVCGCGCYFDQEEEDFTRPKCPHCGSDEHIIDHRGDTYSCECGCWFTIIKK